MAITPTQVRVTLLATLAASFFIATCSKPKTEAPPGFSLNNAVDLGHGLRLLRAGWAGNVILLTGPDGALVVDQQVKENEQRNFDRIRQLSGGVPKYLINTHWHFDHAGGNRVFRQAGTTVIAHENARGRITGELPSTLFGEKMEPGEKGAEPNEVYQTELDLRFDGQTVRIIHVPAAHTDGDSFVYFKEADVLHTGDVFTNHSYPIIDRGSGGTLDGMIAAYRVALDLAGPNTKIIPGHGEQATRADVASELAMIECTVRIVKASIEAGETQDQTIAHNPMKQWRETFNQRNLDEKQFVAQIYQELTHAPLDAPAPK